MFALAEDALKGVGDSTLGEWREVGMTPGVVHLRRRLSVEEQAMGVGAVKDIRGTWEAEKRYKAVERFIPPELRDGTIY